MKKLLSLIVILCFLISCKNPLTTEVDNDYNNNKDDKVIIIDTNKTYEVRLGSKIIETKASTMTNDWINYIGDKKVNSSYNRYFEKETGNYWEDDFSTTQPRAELVGAAIKIKDNIMYLMGIYYNNKILGAGFSQYMLIYIQADGKERGYYGGGADKNKKPDYSTVWTHYASPVDPLGILTDY